MQHKNYALMDKMIDYINSCFESSRRIPTFQQIADNFEITKACVSNYIKEMQQKGLVKVENGCRGVLTEKILKLQQNTLNISVIGSIACGLPMLAEQNIESYISLPKEFLGNGNYFILKAIGKSMINAGIDENDYVVIRQQSTADNGQIVVALIDDEATLKRFYKDDKNKRIRLHPENDMMEDMYFDDIAIQGIVVKVIKNIIF